MKNQSMQYVCMALALIAAANCAKHLLRMGDMASFGFALAKDVAVVVLAAYLYRQAPQREDSKMRNLAVFAMQALLMISFISDYAVEVVGTERLKRLCVNK